MPAVSRTPPSRREALAEICSRHRVRSLYLFGSRAREAARWLRGETLVMGCGGSDLDVAVLPDPARHWDIQAKVRFAARLEDFFGVGRVDLGLLPEMDPFVAVEAIDGERVYAQDPDLADEYELYILRRAGDLMPFERHRINVLLGREEP